MKRARARQGAGWRKLQAVKKHEELVVVDPNVWFQPSRKFRMVARLPEGKTGLQALEEASGEAWSLPEADAADHYCRVYAPAALCMELNHTSFEAFRAAGGDTAMGRAFALKAPQRAEEERQARLALEERRANPPVQVDGLIYCRTCGHDSDDIANPRHGKGTLAKQCTPCRAMRNRGWLGHGDAS